jgi:hypothetical protein
MEKTVAMNMVGVITDPRSSRDKVTEAWGILQEQNDPEALRELICRLAEGTGCNYPNLLSEAQNLFEGVAAPEQKDKLSFSLRVIEENMFR